MSNIVLYKKTNQTTLFSWFLFFFFVSLACERFDRDTPVLLVTSPALDVLQPLTDPVLFASIFVITLHKYTQQYLFSVC